MTTPAHPDMWAILNTKTGEYYGASATEFTLSLYTAERVANNVRSRIVPRYLSRWNVGARTWVKYENEAYVNNPWKVVKVSVTPV